MKENEDNSDQAVLEKLNKFKKKLNSESSGIDPIDILTENKKNNKRAQAPRQRQATPQQQGRVPPSHSPQQQPQVNAQQIRDTNLVLGTALINIFERFGQQLTPTEEAALLTAIGERCPWYIQKLREQVQARAAAAQSQVHTQAEGIDDNTLMEDPETEYVPFMEDDEEGFVTG